MLLVRTDRTAILIGAVITALFTLEVVRTGLVMTAQDSSSLDAWVVMALATGALYAIQFAIGHALLRKYGIRSRSAYAGLGAVAAIAPFLLAMGRGPLSQALEKGSLSALLVCPLVVGALSGFLYHRRAGYDRAGDDPDRLATATGQAADASGLGGTVRTDHAEYFDGPLVVRSSLGANALAALLASAAFILASTLSAWVDPYESPLTQFMARNGAGKTVVQGILGTAIPIMVLLALTHGFLRARGKSSYRDYATAGVVGPVIFSILIGMTGVSWLAFLYLLQFLAPSLIAMLAYRRLAGLEPAPLPDDIEVSDRRTLVGADHVRRRMVRVIDAAHP